MIGSKNNATVSSTAATVAGADTDNELKLQSNIIAGKSQSAQAPVISPLEFENFVPWVCKQWCTSTAILITRKTQGQENQTRKSITIKAKSLVFGNGSKPRINDEFSSLGCVQIESKKNLLVFSEQVVPITTYYDAKKRLIEIAFLECKVHLSRKIIHAISLAVPYHSTLTRFTFRRSKLTCDIIYEISKLLPISNITEVCLDDSEVKEGNYYVLLEQYSQLKYLSLNRCNINDAICKKIFTNIDFGAPAATTLQLLDLACNEITDEGAKFIGQVLRLNRCLMHLNLSGNRITDEGFRPIIESLMEFPLKPDDIMTMRRRKITHIQSKMSVYLRCLTDLKYGKGPEPLEDLDNSTCERKTLTKRLRKKSKKTTLHQSAEDVADVMTQGIVGDFYDPFASDNLVYKDDVAYCMGNFILCYLNLAYNNLEFPSVQRIRHALAYQDEVTKVRNETGLIRVVLDGNYIPQNCDELDEIDIYLKKAIFLRNHTRKTKVSSSTKRLCSSTKCSTSFEEKM
ncbi:unnamed protein product [Spodoptera exigua]|nr:unnamed protein product [Spodoptera exigua]